MFGGPGVSDIRITLRNLQSLLTSDEYRSGLDNHGVARMLGDICVYISGSSSHRISLPAPISNPDDTHRLMWPEGATVKSKPRSNTSYASGVTRYSRSHSIAPNAYNSQHAYSRASSLVSSAYPSRYVGIVESGETAPAYESKRQVHNAHPTPSAMRVSGAVIKPTPSMEKFLRKTDTPDGNDDDNYYEDEQPVPIVIRKGNTKPRPMFTQTG